jgi:hypothetical protein
VEEVHARDGARKDRNRAARVEGEGDDEPEEWDVSEDHAAKESFFFGW